MDWKKLKKIDAHVHLLPKDCLKKQTDAQDSWANASVEEYSKIMQEYNIEKAILLPINDGWTFYSNVEKTNEWLSNTTKNNPNKFIAFADVLSAGGYFAESSPNLLEKSIKKYNLSGLKLHPSNLGIDIDSLEMVPVLRKAADLKLPTIIHSNPYARTNYDCCSAAKIHKMARIFPDLTIIIAHLGGAGWQDALQGNEYVDISYVLPQFVELYGIEQTNRILRAFGADRLIFGTDFPQAYGCKYNEILEKYCNILNQMDFTKEEAEKIAYKNILKILNKKL